MNTALDTLFEAPHASTASPVKTPSKSRSFSDPPNANANTTPATLAPSPTFHEKLSLTSKDDHALPTTPLRSPRSSRRPELGRGLSLQMPPGLSMPSPSHFPLQPRGVQPLSPQLDQHQIYMHASSQQASPATSLPRHSRGLDWSRACSTLHHSTLPEQSSPDSSPVITQKGMMIPGFQQQRSRRQSISSVMMLDSPNMNAPGTSLGGGGMWGSLGQEKSTLSSSVGSVNMLASDSESSESDDDASMAGDDTEDPVFATPQVQKLQNPHTAATPFAIAPSTPSGGGGGWGNGAHFSPAQASLMKTMRRSRLQKNGRRSRKSSSSASGSGYSSMASPRTNSPPPLRSIESAANGGYFQWTAAARSRRESLALGTDGLHLSSGNDSGDEASAQNSPATPGVVRRPVVRRGNLLPKTKGFARIRAALLEEAAPVDAEVRRESETLRQVRERDGGLSIGDDVFADGNGSRPQTATGGSSPSLLPAVPEAVQEDFDKDLESEDSANANGKIGLGMNFAVHANRNSGGMDYWQRFDPSQNRTPPPPSFPRNGSSGLMSDINTYSEASQNTPLWRRARARSSASDAGELTGGTTTAATNAGAAGVMNDDMHLNRFKRRREDDFDIATIKRRAVSPGMSAQNSPVLTQSPTQKDLANAAWGHPPERKASQKDKDYISQPVSAGSDISQSSQLPPPLSLAGSRQGSGGSLVSVTSMGGTLTPAVGNAAGQGKKLGLQGMVDTNDGLMKMSIE